MILDVVLTIGCVLGAGFILICCAGLGTFLREELRK